MVLKLRVRICRDERCIEAVAIANTGFSGKEPEITLPQDIARILLGESYGVVLIERILGDGTRTLLPRTTDRLRLQVLAEDRSSGIIEVYAYVTRGGVILLNDHVISGLGIVIIDPLKGEWCFKDELGKRIRRGVTQP